MTSSPMLKAAVNSELLTFTDSDFAFCEKTRKSSLIYWKPGKQNHVSRSTTEAEFYAFLEGITEVEFLQDVIHFAYKVDKRIFNCKNTPIFCDNSSAGKIANSIESIARTKHIEVWKVSLYRKNQIHSLCREEEPPHSSSVDPMPARLKDYRRALNFD